MENIFDKKNPKINDFLKFGCEIIIYLGFVYWNLITRLSYLFPICSDII